MNRFAMSISEAAVLSVGLVSNIPGDQDVFITLSILALMVAFSIYRHRKEIWAVLEANPVLSTSLL